MTGTDLADLSAAELLQAYRTRAASPLEATQAVLARIDALDPLLNAFCRRDDAAALEAARASGARWAAGEARPLDGVPVSIKDLVLMAGAPTLRGSRTVDPAQAWDEDAPATARLREAGAVLIGKTTTPEFGCKAFTDSRLTGITRNPWSPAHTPGGSSGGAAAAVASGMGPLAVGTDGGGSIRLPASYCGLVGLKASSGRVPAWPPSIHGSLAHVGPITRTLTDAALMLSVLAQPDARDFWALANAPHHYASGLDDGVRGLRIGFAPQLGGAHMDPAVAQAVAEAVAIFETLGAHVETVAAPFADLGPVQAVLWCAGADLIVSAMSADMRALLDPVFAAQAAFGAQFTGHQVQDAHRRRAEAGYAMAAFHQRYDLLLTPTTPTTAPLVRAPGEMPEGVDDLNTMVPFTFPFNMTGQPAVSVPCGVVDGRPIGLQIVGPPRGDALVLRVARAFEATQPVRRPDLGALARRA